MVAGNQFSHILWQAREQLFERGMLDFSSLRRSAPDEGNAIILRICQQLNLLKYMSAKRLKSQKERRKAPILVCHKRNRTQLNESKEQQPLFTTFLEVSNLASNHIPGDYRGQNSNIRYTSSLFVLLLRLKFCTFTLKG